MLKLNSTTYPVRIIHFCECPRVYIYQLWSLFSISSLTRLKTFCKLKYAAVVYSEDQLFFKFTVCLTSLMLNFMYTMLLHILCIVAVCDWTTLRARPSVCCRDHRCRVCNSSVLCVSGDNGEQRGNHRASRLPLTSDLYMYRVHTLSLHPDLSEYPFSVPPHGIPSKHHYSQGGRLQHKSPELNVQLQSALSTSFNIQIDCFLCRWIRDWLHAPFGGACSQWLWPLFITMSQ